MKPVPPKIKAIGEKCAWCSGALVDPHMLCAELPKGYPIKPDWILLPVELQKLKRVVHAIVLQPGSPGKQEGFDVVFGACSDQCAAKLRAAIEEDAPGFELRN